MKIEITDEEKTELVIAISICGYQKPDAINWEIIDKFLAKLEAKSLKI